MDARELMDAGFYAEAEVAFKVNQSPLDRIDNRHGTARKCELCGTWSDNQSACPWCGAAIS